MNNLLERLGIKCSVDKIKNGEDAWDMYDFLDLPMPNELELVFESAKILLKQRKQWEEMLEALINTIIGLEKLPPLKALEGVLQREHDLSIKVIEKATGKTWEEIKELINE